MRPPGASDGSASEAPFDTPDITDPHDAIPSVPVAWTVIGVSLKRSSNSFGSMRRPAFGAVAEIEGSRLSRSQRRDLSDCLG